MSKVILVVDDSETIRCVVSAALRENGFTVVEAIDGIDALEKCDGRKFNLVISDLNMPNMNGIQFIREMKKLSRYKFTPVIVLTTEQGEDIESQGKSAGAKIWMAKPFQVERVLATINKLILP